MSEATKETTILLRNTTKLLPVKLTDLELRQAGSELASTVQEINAEDERQKNIKDQLKARMSELVARQSSIAFRISRGEDFREIPVAIELHSSGQVSETRLDTGEVLSLREATDEELQLQLKPEEEKEN